MERRQRRSEVAVVEQGGSSLCERTTVSKPPERRNERSGTAEHPT